MTRKDPQDSSGSKPAASVHQTGRKPSKTTARQREARSKNAKEHSTGPRSAEGKSISALNAVKHGGFAKPETVLALAKRGGGEHEVALLREAIRAELQPETTFQSEILDGLAAAVFQTRRLSQLGVAALAPNRALGHLESGQLDELDLRTVIQEANMCSYNSVRAAAAAETVRNLASGGSMQLAALAGELVDMGELEWPADWNGEIDEVEPREWRRRIKTLLAQLELTAAAASKLLRSRGDRYANLAVERLEHAEGCAARAVLERGVVENLQRAQHFNQRQVHGWLAIYASLTNGEDEA